MGTDLQLGRTQSSGLMDVLDRVLDKGIVIDAWVRVSLVGIDLITVEARVVVASIDTYLKYSEAVGQTPTVAQKGIEAKTHEALLAENASLKAQLASVGATTERRRRRAEEPMAAAVPTPAPSGAEAPRDAAARPALVELLPFSDDAGEGPPAPVDWL